MVQPAAIEAAVMASEEQARKVDEVVAALQRDLEAARYSARRAQKQYDAGRSGEPSGDRRTRTALESGACSAFARSKRRSQQHRDRQGQAAAPTREEFAELAADLEAVWNDPAADARLKKRVIRTLIRDIIVDVDAQAGEVDSRSFTGRAACIPNCVCRAGGAGRTARTPSTEALEAVRVLAHICSDQLIAGVLNRNGLLTGRGNRWTQERVTALRSHHDIPCYRADQRGAERWMNLTEAARHLGVSSKNTAPCRRAR